jgi:carbamoylphosphate synthase large subunit
VPFVAKTIGRPIAKIAAKLAVGYTLDELKVKVIQVLMMQVLKVMLKAKVKRKTMKTLWLLK